MTTHPADPKMTLGRASVWYGPEVEGSLRAGLFTAFVTRPVYSDEWRALQRSLYGRVEHVFLTELFDDWGWFVTKLLPLLAEKGLPVTKAIYPRDIEGFSKLSFRSCIDLIVRACDDATWIHLLRPCDQVSVGYPYCLIAWRVGEATKTTPDDYKKDTLE